jgi:hypothetical protein
LVLDGISSPAPFTRTVIVNSALDLAAPSSQNGRVFSAWSDGGARSRSLVFGPSSQALTATYSIATTTSCTGTGSIVREVWNGIAGYSVSDLTSSSSFANAPSLSQTLSSFEAPSNQADNYGVRVRGYLCPPTSGPYTFWLASDDSSQLFLSTDENPANKQQLINFAGWTPPRDWTRYPQQASRPITLTAGTRYYIEALHKEQNGGDHLSVAWHGPGLSAQIIPGQSLAPFATNAVTTTSFVIYDEALASGWANWSFNTTLDFNNTSPVQTGSRSLRATTTTAYGTLALRAPNAIALAPYSALEFWAYGGATGNTLAAFIQDGDGSTPSPFIFFTTQANVWKKISMPLAAFGSFAQLKRVNIQDVSGAGGGQYVLDDLKLVGTTSPPSTDDFVLYGDAIAAGWSNWSGNVNVNFDATSPVTVGVRAAAASVTAPYGTFTLRGETAQSASQFASLSLWVYGGPGGNTLAAFVQEGDSTTPSPFVFFTTQANAWRKITIPLSSFGAISQIKRVNFQDVSGASGGQYVVDDLRLVGTGAAMNAATNAPERAVGGDWASAALAAHTMPNGTALSWQLRGVNDAKAVQVWASQTDDWREAALLTRPPATAQFYLASGDAHFYWLVIERDGAPALGVGPIRAEPAWARVYLPMIQ